MAKKEDKNKVVKKKKANKFNRVNVYFNSDSKGSSKYFLGKFYSHKNDRIFTYRSSYELKYFLDLENDPKVHSYLSEGLHIPYKNSWGKNKVYIPDLLVLYSDGSMKVIEIKPYEMLKDADVILKAEACRLYLKKNCKDQQITYQFITEKHLFKNQFDYLNFINANRDKDFSVKGKLS